MGIWKILAGAAAVALALQARPDSAQAQNYPTRAITLVIPFAPGGSTSIVGRGIADKMSELLGEKGVQERPPVMGGEDFARYGREGVPIFLYFLGTLDPKRIEASLRPGGDPLPSLHSDRYYPIPEPSIRTGVLTMSMAVLGLMAK